MTAPSFPAAINIRLAIASDADAISALAISTFPLGCPPETDPADIALHGARELTPDNFRAYIADPAATTLVAHVADELVGYAIFIRGEVQPLLPSVDAQAQAEVRKFYVDPRFHGAGIAHELMRRELEAHADAGVIWLSVNAENKRAQIFYAKFGFTVIGKQQYRVGNDLQDDLVMCRRAKQKS